MEEYLSTSKVIDWSHPEIIELAKQIASGHVVGLVPFKSLVYTRCNSLRGVTALLSLAPMLPTSC